MDLRSHHHAAALCRKETVRLSREETGGASARLCRSTREVLCHLRGYVGKLRWADGGLDGDHLICVVSEQVPQDYLAMLQEKGISYIVSGRSGVDLANAVNQLAEHFGIRTLLLEGGGHINGAFLQAGLIDEVSLLVVPGIDGRHDIPAVFDGVNPSRKKAVPLRLKSVEKRGRDSLWIRYEVVRSKTTKRRNNAKAQIRKK